MTATAPIQYAFELGQEVMWLTRRELPEESEE